MWFRLHTKTRELSAPKSEQSRSLEQWKQSLTTMLIKCPIKCGRLETRKVDTLKFLSTKNNWRHVFAYANEIVQLLYIICLDHRKISWYTMSFRDCLIYLFIRRWPIIGCHSSDLLILHVIGRSPNDYLWHIICVEEVFSMLLLLYVVL